MSDVAMKATGLEGLALTLMKVAKTLPMKLGVKPSMNATGRRMVYCIFASAALALRWASMSCLLMK